MIPYGRQDINQDDIDAVIEVLSSDFITQGPLGQLFEKTVANYCGAQFSVSTSSATAGLHIACLALDLGPGDWLWTSPNTFVASANCALYCGAKVDFVDIDPNTYNISIDRLTQKLAEAERIGKLPKIVVPVHLCGQSCDMAAIHALSQKYGFKIIENSAHGIGGKYKNEPIGNCRYSDITIFSFHPVKIITTGEGGMALTNDPDLADRMYRYRSHGITSEPSAMLPRPSNEIWNYQQVKLGFHYRMTDIQSALGISQMSRLDEFVTKRHQIAKRYDDELSDLTLQLPWQHKDSYSSYHLYPIRIRSDAQKTQRQIYDALQLEGIGVNLHYIPVYRQPYYEDMGFKMGYCPEAEQYYREALSIPMYSKMLTSEHSVVITILQDLLS